MTEGVEPTGYFSVELLETYSETLLVPAPLLPEFMALLGKCELGTHIRWNHQPAKDCKIGPISFAEDDIKYITPERYEEVYTAKLNALLDSEPEED